MVDLLCCALVILVCVCCYGGWFSCGFGLFIRHGLSFRVCSVWILVVSFVSGCFLDIAYLARFGVVGDGYIVLGGAVVCCGSLSGFGVGLLLCFRGFLWWVCGIRLC